MMSIALPMEMSTSQQCLELRREVVAGRHLCSYVGEM